MFSMGGSAFAYDNPELLPKEQTPIIDLAKTLSEKQRLELGGIELEKLLLKIYGGLHI